MSAPTPLTALLPDDWREATFVGRMDFGEGPSPVVLRGGRVFDSSRHAPTVSHLLGRALPTPSACRDVGAIADVMLQAAADAPGARPRVLAPVDLQVIKACGVTFAASALERVIEEQARGDAGRAQALRSELTLRAGELSALKPGSAAARAAKEALIEAGAWSQYLEVAIGPDAELFTKAPILSAVGWGDWVGVRSDSTWNNSEPEIVLVCDAASSARGATLGNDLNLRDFEGRSALLLGKAKDNNASCALGPFIRLFDDRFTLDDIRNAEIELEVDGADGFTLRASGSMRGISRDPLDLIAQSFGATHAYPDGAALFLGTMIAPTTDRETPGMGFTHKRGDVVRVHSRMLGALINTVTTSEEAPAWTFGISALFANLARRGLALDLQE